MIDKQLFNVTVFSGLGGLVSEDGGDAADFFLFRREIGTVVNLTAHADTGYKFAGWYEVIEDGEDSFFSRLSVLSGFSYTTELNGITLRASFVETDMQAFIFVIEKSVLNSLSTEYGDITAGEGVYFEGEYISIIAQAREGFSFVAWYENEELFSENPRVNIQVTESKTLTAVFEVETFRLYITDGLGAKERIEKIEADSLVTLKAVTPPSGYRFIGWTILNISDYEQNLEKREVVFYATHYRIKVIAEYAPNIYKVTISYNDINYGAALGAGNYQVGDTVTIKPIAKTGYCVSKFSIRGVELQLSEDGTCSFIMPDEQIAVRVEFTTIDNIDVEQEIIVMASFSAGVLGVLALLLFYRKPPAQVNKK